jgi:membrane-anchored mycosin MYCP
MVDPVAALTFSFPAGERTVPGAQTRMLTPAPPPPPPDDRAHTFALAFTAVVIGAALMVSLIARARRSR